MPERKLRIGIIGDGRRGRAHIRTITELPDLYELAAVSDPAYAHGKEPAQEARQARSYISVRDLLSKEKLDVAVIATPPETHHIIATLVAERGVPMLIETPLALTRAMMNVLAGAIAKAGVPAEAGENMWRRPVEQLNQKAIAQGLIGRVLRVSSYYESAGSDSCYHTMSLLRTYAGADAEAVRSFSREFPLDPIPGQKSGEEKPSEPIHPMTGLTEEKWTQAELRYANGVLGSCTYVTGWMGPLRRGHPRFMTIEGTEGFIITGDADVNTLRRVEGFTPRDYPKRVAFQKLGDREVPMRYYYETHPEVEYRNPFSDRFLTDSGAGGVPSDGIARAHELQSIFNSITRGADPRYSVARARRDQELSITIHEAAGREGWLRSVELPDETEWERSQHEVFRKEWGADPIKELPALLKRM